MIEATQTAEITRAAHHVAQQPSVLGAEYIGTVAKGSHIEWFEAQKCPEELDEWACDAATRRREGVHKNVYHWQAWVLGVKCPFCKASGFKSLESRSLSDRKASVPCIVCGKCGCVLEAYKMEYTYKDFRKNA